MRQLLPYPAPDVDVLATYAADARPARPDRPWVLLDMVASADGAMTVDGRSRGLSSPGDRLVFHSLRVLADVILVGAGTARAERYGPPRLPEDAQRARVAADRPPQPTLVVVSASLHFPDDQPFLQAGAPRPTIATVGTADPAQRAALAERADVLVAGEQALDPAALLRALRSQGHEVVLCEGGPTLNGALAARGLIDEVCLSVAPLMVSGPAGRIVDGPQLAAPATMTLDRALEEDGTLFLRYLVGAPAGVSR